MDIDFRIALIWSTYQLQQKLSAFVVCWMFWSLLGKQCRPKQTVAVCFCAYLLVNNLNKYMQQPKIGCNDQPQFLAGFWRLYQTSFDFYAYFQTWLSLIEWRHVFAFLQTDGANLLFLSILKNYTQYFKSSYCPASQEWQWCHVLFTLR